MKLSFRTFRSAVYRLFGTRTVRWDGVKIVAFGNGIPPEVTRMLRRGKYEGAERELLLRVLTPADRVLEIGSGMGVLSLVAAKVCGAQNVRGYEANPITMPLIAANQALNSLYPDIIGKAVSVDGQPLEFHVMENIISSSVFQRDGSRSIRVESVAIRDAIADFNPTILLMDAEGAELDLLPAADLSNIRAIIVETHSKFTGAKPLIGLRAHLEACGLPIAMEQGNNWLCLRDTGQTEPRP